MVREGSGDVNDYSSATGTYRGLAWSARWCFPPGAGFVARPRAGPLRSHDQALDRDQVVQHGPMGRHLVPAPDRLQDPHVILMGAGRPTRRLQWLLAALGQ